jgi:alpha-amylase
MSSICFYFQVHQPYRLKRYTYLSVGRDHHYFDDARNAEIMRRVAHKSYLPANRAMLELIRKHEGAFRIAYSITGTAIEQMKEYCPQVVDSFRALADTGCVEFLAETYYHSLAAQFNPVEFAAQVTLHSEVIEREFGVRPTVFRNTELIYSNAIAQMAHKLGFRAVLAEGADQMLGWRSPNVVYRAAGSPISLLLKNYRLSDDIAFRFSDPHAPGYPLTPEKFAAVIHSLGEGTESVGLFMDYETFGEHQWESTGIFDFLKRLPSALMSSSGWNFATPSEIVENNPPRSEISCPDLTSWADLSRDVTAWQGNSMQRSALDKVYCEFAPVDDEGSAFPIDPKMLAVWRKLQGSDHFYYMSTKPAGDGAVHSYFSPYESPYDAFITYMNVMRDFKGWIFEPGQLFRSEAVQQRAVGF